ncbi:MAG TPA: hypothetical protein VJO35_13295 [Terriglobales bacterium]|nr:hypothetical protein [Terriglobales bacterium]
MSKAGFSEKEFLVTPRVNLPLNLDKGTEGWDIGGLPGDLSAQNTKPTRSNSLRRMSFIPVD